MRKAIPVALAALALAAPSAASAHVTIQPSEAAAGGYARLDVRVPNERDDAGTRKVEVQLPPGIESVGHEPVEGWDIEVRSEGGEAATVAFTASDDDDVIAPGQFRDFGLSLKVPGKAGESLTFKAVQTYDSGEVVRWIGPEDADEPAPTLKLTAQAAEGGHAAAEQPAAAAAPAASGGDDGPSDGLVVAALAAGGLGLLAGLAGLVAARRVRRPATA